ncbi:MAG: radical SAM protein [Acidobacteriota bacterium]|nr:radical SAM protein [Acidobacteriota bacterium]
MPEITFIVDDLRGAILVEDNQDLSAEALALLKENLGEAREIACARPLEISKPPVSISGKETNDVAVRIAGYYHNSLTDGPGRRSSVLFQFCPLKCKGCYVPQLHSKNAGELISVEKLAELLLDPKHERDGVTILGGEPFAQPEGLNALVKTLRSKNCRHIVCYSGYTLEVIWEKAVKQPAIGEVLCEIDILIDGAYVESLADSAGLWTGSGNQRVIDLAATQRSERIILYS